MNEVCRGWKCSEWCPGIIGWIDVKANVWWQLKDALLWTCPRLAKWNQVRKSTVLVDAESWDVIRTWVPYSDVVKLVSTDVISW